MRRDSDRVKAMEPFKAKTIQGIVYADPELREQMRESREQYLARAEANRLAAEEFERSRPERLKAFWQRLGYTPDRAGDERRAERSKLLAMAPAEAWIFEHPEEFNSETAATLAALGRLIQLERRRLKAARRILKEVGIR